jgi:hypothetical protein
MPEESMRGEARPKSTPRERSGVELVREPVIPDAREAKAATPRIVSEAGTMAALAKGGTLASRG